VYRLSDKTLKRVNRSHLRAVVVNDLQASDVAAERRRRDVGRQDGQPAVARAVLEPREEVDDGARRDAADVDAGRREAVVDAELQADDHEAARRAGSRAPVDGPPSACVRLSKNGRAAPSPDVEIHST